MSASAFAFAFQQAEWFHKLIEVAASSFSPRASQCLNFAIGDSTADPYLNHDLNLSIVQAECLEPLTIMSRHGDDKLGSVVVELRSTNARFGTQSNHVQRAGSQFLDVPSEEQTFGQFAVSRIRRVFDSQLFDRQFRW